MRPSRSDLIRPAAFVVAIFATACGDDDVTSSSPLDEIAEFQAIIDSFDLGPLPAIPYPPGNRFNAERIALGQLLFWDPILGGESAPWLKQAHDLDPYRHRANDVACATCHFPTLGFADGRRLGAGVSGAQFRDTDIGPERVVPGFSYITGMPVGTEPRNSPTILNTAFNGKNSIMPAAESFQFMDGRVTLGLEEQATLPITSRDEMAGDAYGPHPTKEQIQDSVTQRIRDIPEYVARFEQAFAGEIASADDIKLDHIGRAIAAFERELITPNSRYDQFVQGQYDEFTAQEREGLKLFFGKGLCGDCHSGPMLSDFTFRVQGVGDAYESIIPGFAGKNGQGGDFGRFHADTIELASRKFAFRVLTVRNVELTSPFFHSGSAGTLHDAVEFYNRGGLGAQDVSDATLTEAGVTRDPSIRPLDLTASEIDAIVAFMRTTTAPVQQGPLGVDLVGIPLRVPSGLSPPGVATPEGPGPFFAKASVRQELTRRSSEARTPRTWSSMRRVGRSSSAAPLRTAGRIEELSRQRSCVAVDGLTTREVQVLRLVATGITNRAIAAYALDRLRTLAMGRRRRRRHRAGADTRSDGRWRNMTHGAGAPSRLHHWRDATRREHMSKQRTHYVTTTDGVSIGGAVHGQGPRRSSGSARP